MHTGNLFLTLQAQLKPPSKILERSNILCRDSEIIDTLSTIQKSAIGDKKTAIAFEPGDMHTVT